MTRPSFFIAVRRTCCRHPTTSLASHNNVLHSTTTTQTTLHPWSTVNNVATETHTTIIPSSSSSNVEILSSQDIIIGSILAFLLAFLYSYLNGQSSSTDFVSWRSSSQESNIDTLSSNVVPMLKNGTTDTLNDGNSTTSSKTVFNETNWREMSRTENYILYNTRIRNRRLRQPSAKTIQSRSTTSKYSENSSSKNNNSQENKLVLVALLALFLPIFSIEIFFALSRQFLCEGHLFGGGDVVVERLCSPITSF